MWRITLREIRTHFGRFLLTLIAVMLGVAFLSGTLALRGIMVQTIAGVSTSTLNGDLYAVGEPRTEDSQPLSFQLNRKRISTALAGIIKEVDGVSDVQEEISGSAILLDAQGEAVSIAGSPATVRAVYPFPPGPEIVAGRLPSGPSEIMLDSGAMVRGHFHVGDTARMLINGSPNTYTIVGESSYGAPLATTTLVFMDPNVLRPLFAADGTVPSIAVSVAASSEVKVVKERVQTAVGPDARVITGDKLRAEATARVSDVLGFVNVLVLLFVVVALAIGVFIISNTFYMAVHARGREFALLRAIGASPRAIFWTIALQAAIIGLIGAVLGIATGWGLVAFALKVLDWMGMSLPISASLSAQNMAISLVVGVAVSVGGSLLPAHGAARTRPVEAMRNFDSTREKPLKIRTLAAGVVGLIAVAFLAVSLSRAAGERFSLELMGFGLALMVVAVLMFSPLLATGFFTLCGRALAAFHPAQGKLTRGNLVRSPRRTASTSGALIVGIALVAGGGVVASSAETSVADAIKNEVHTDLVVSVMAQTSDAAPAAATIRQIPAVETVYDDLKMGTVSVVGRDGKHDTDYLGTITVKEATKILPMEVSAGKVDTLDQGKALVSLTRAQLQGWKVGDVITFTGNGGSYTTKIGAIVQSRTFGASFFVNPGVGRQIAVDTMITPLMLVKVKHDALQGEELKSRVNKVRADIAEALRPFHIYKVLTPDQYQSATVTAIRQILAALYALLGLSIFIAILGITNTLSLAVLSRTREIGLLRAVGMSSRSSRRLITNEALLISAYGALMGTVVGIVMAAIVRFYLRDLGLMSFSIPWLLLLVIFAAALLAGLLASLVPAARAARLGILESLREV